MPSIKTTLSANFRVFSKRTLSTASAIVVCTSLVACGGGSGTSRTNNNSDTTSTPKPKTPISLTAQLPMDIRQGTLEVVVIGESKPIYSGEYINSLAETVGTTVSDLSSTYKGKIVWVKLIGDEKTTMYDPILNVYVPFKGTLNAIATIQDKMVIHLTPVSEAIFQRSLVRAGNLNLDTPDLTLVQDKHINKATSEIKSSLSEAFFVNRFPLFNSSYSIRDVIYNDKSTQNYINTFVGLGLLQLWQNRFPDSKNAFLELAQNLAVDLRDGYLDGRTTVGDQTSFLTLVDAPKNIDPEKNTLLDIGATQKQTRENFGEELKAATLSYAEKTNQQDRYPLGLAKLKTHAYYTPLYTSNSTGRFRWVGAGDYRPAFGISTTATCDDVRPCKRALNADDIGVNYSDIEYLIGTHKIGQCTIKFFPNGDVELLHQQKMYRSQINRDLIDNILQLDTASQHYLLNIGSGEVKPSHFIQLEIINGNIIDIQTGFSQNFYPTKTDIDVQAGELASCL